MQTERIDLTFYCVDLYRLKHIFDRKFQTNIITFVDFGF